MITVMLLSKHTAIVIFQYNETCIHTSSVKLHDDINDIRMFHII